MGKFAGNLRYHVLVVGSLANNDLILANSLTGLGVRCVVVRFPSVPDSLDRFKKILPNLPAVTILPYRGPWDFYRLARRVKCVVSFTSNFTYAMHWCLALWRLLPFPPVINYTTGSDIMELAVAPSLHGFVYRWFLKRAALTVLVPIPAYRESIRRLKLRSSGIVPRFATTW